MLGGRRMVTTVDLDVKTEKKQEGLFATNRGNFSRDRSFTQGDNCRQWNAGGAADLHARQLAVVEHVNYRSLAVGNKPCFFRRDAASSSDVAATTPPTVCPLESMAENS